jgi:enoyl-CoA hydratase/carnithine racemase
MATGHALDMILRAKKVTGPEALEIGLVTEVWPLAELKDRAIARVTESGDIHLVDLNEDRPGPVLDVSTGPSLERTAVRSSLPPALHLLYT